uniref:S8 family serine peptidase n=1 Tax=uncultured Allobacillus sp. TaxID=1638025 RepID=UPI0025923EFA|nr:S8 family serine peptidase [uncultured Allobacillus sp.]
MHKKFCMTLIIVLIFLSNIVQADEEQTWIIEMENAPEDLEAILQKNYPFIEVLHMYDTLLEAVAVQGKERHIEQLYEEAFVTTIHSAQTYQVTHAHTENSALEKANYHPENIEQTGKNVKVGVIDTGIDYTHMDLEANYQAGFDTVDFDEDPMETTVEQGVPTLHGTHVAGIIAARGEITGVAPDAEIYAYRALGPGGSGTTAEIIAALEEAVDDGMDVVNLSLGNEVNSPDSPMTEAVNRAVELGVSVVVANGNSGPDLWTVGSPATAEKAVSVGAYAPVQYQPYIELPNSHRIDLAQVPLSASWKFSKRMPLEPVTTVEELDRSITDRVILIEKEKTYLEMMAAIMEKGASAVIVYSEEDPNSWEFVELPIPVAYISKDDAKQLQSAGNWFTTKYEQLTDKLATFSSRGPVTSNWQSKPDIIAPGVNILSTVPGGYAELQGTSMAAPYITGLLALLIEKDPDASPEELKNRLISHANPIDELNQSAIDQGAGVADIARSVERKYTIKDKAIHFGKVDQDDQTIQRSITIENHEEDPMLVRWEIPRKQPGIQWKLPFTTEIAPGTSESFPVELRVSTDRLTQELLEGYVYVSVGDERVSLPYTLVTEEADYPRISGIELEPIPFKENKYNLSVYLAEEVEQLEVAIISDDFSETNSILEETNINEGKFQATIQIDEMSESSQYLIVQVVQNGKTYSSEVQLNS